MDYHVTLDKLCNEECVPDAILAIKSNDLLIGEQNILPHHALDEEEFLNESTHLVLI